MSFYGVSYGPRIRSGAGSLDSLGDEVGALAGRGAPVLLVADAGLKPFGLIDRALAALAGSGLQTHLYADIAGEPNESQVEAARQLGRSAGVRAVVCLGGGSALAVHLFTDVKSDPLAAQVDAGAKIARRERLSAVVALGGGSALDAGKLAAALLATDEPVAAFRLAASPFPAKAVPIICVPTTAGTGSEMTGISVVSDASKVKYWFWGAGLEADLALLDAELTYALPAPFTAMTGMDALVHAIEAATNRNAGPESDVAAYAAIRLVVAHLRDAVRHPADPAARAGMLEASALGGLAIHKAGTALAHNIGHALGSLAPVPHGLAVTLAFAATAEWVVEGNRSGFGRVADAMGLGPEPDAVPAAFRQLARDIGLSLETGAAAPGLTTEALARSMAAPENATMRKSTKRLVADEDLLTLAGMTLGLRRP
jgi:alcohol dehydrogenase class IV